MEAQVLSRRLPHINDVKPLNDLDLPIMQDIYEVLARHHALKRFGVTLLHEHFDIPEDEVLIETTNIAKREQYIFAVKKSEVENIDAIETSWRLDTGKAVMNCKCIKERSNHEHYSRG